MSCLLMLMKSLNGFMKITLLLIPENIISCVLERIHQMKLLFQKFSNEEQQKTKKACGYYRQRTEL